VETHLYDAGGERHVVTTHTVTELERGDREAFVDALGDVYESSPWVAERAWNDRPFGSLADLRESLQAVVEDASERERLELLRAHPDLGEQTEMTDASEAEQASAGLDQLSPEQYEAFERLNERYRERFGFPFIMAVTDASPPAIRTAMEERVEHPRATEFRTAVAEVHEIARLRLDERIEDG
jgi:2-oxo-4-hydroxy-4-carboxy-5-ureidoimidazoline decarboxylase